MVNLSNLRFDDRAPVYQQIAEYLKRQILLGTVQDGYRTAAASWPPRPASTPTPPKKPTA